MTVVSVREARTRLYGLIDQVAASGEPIRITGRRHNAVLVSEPYRRGLQETLHLLAVPGMRASIRKGLATPVSECGGEPGW